MFLLDQLRAFRTRRDTAGRGPTPQHPATPLLPPSQRGRVLRVAALHRPVGTQDSPVLPAGQVRTGEVPVKPPSPAVRVYRPAWWQLGWQEAQAKLSGGNIKREQIETDLSKSEQGRRTGPRFPPVEGEDFTDVVRIAPAKKRRRTLQGYQHGVELPATYPAPRAGQRDLVKESIAFAHDNFPPSRLFGTFVRVNPVNARSHVAPGFAQTLGPPERYAGVQPFYR